MTESVNFSPQQPALNADQRPVIIIGAGRSGTNMLRDALTQLSGFSTWPCDEINYIWRHGNRAHPTDEFTSAMASPVVTRFIRRAFTQQLRRATAQSASSRPPVLIEKTCANSLRVPFVNAIFPDARFVHIVRDGRDVIRSAQHRWKAALDLRYLVAKARFVPRPDLPFYAQRYARNRWHKLRNPDAALSVWGPQFSGMQALSDEGRTLEYICAAQWLRCVTLATSALAELPAERVFTLRYEDFVQNPNRYIVDLVRFSGSADPCDSDVESISSGITMTSVGKGRDGIPLSDDTYTLISEMLASLGYD